MEAVLKCNKGFSTTSKPGTLAPPKGIHFLHKALQNDKEKNMSTIKNVLRQVSQIGCISIKSI